jgi:ubiquitin-protein ligase E3 A
VRELFNVGYGMFTYDDESREFWFSQTSMESESEFHLVGTILGLAIYNDVILDVHFPLVVYKKLLGGKPNLEDLKDARPQVGRSLQKLLDFEGDVEGAFGLDFQVRGLVGAQSIGFG